MAYRNNIKRIAAVAALTVSFAFAVSACSSDDNATPSDSSDAGSASTGGSTSSNSAGGATSRSTSTVNAGSSAAGGSTTAGTAGATSTGGTTSTDSTSVACVLDTAANCYPACTPNTTEQFLNACASDGALGSCSAYDNSALSQLNADGSVPALP